MQSMSDESIKLARMTDHAVLKPTATKMDVCEAVAMCIELGVGNLCVRPVDALLAATLLRGSSTTLAVVIGFPHGSNRSEVKALEAELAIRDGAQELDMVMQLSKFLSGDHEYVRNDIQAVVDVAKPAGVTVKVIIESGLLDAGQIAAACEIAIAAGADFVKTSTGFNGSGATLEAVRTMIKSSNGRIMVKASGGIRTRTEAAAFIKAGVDRLGLSSTADILAQ